MPTGDDGDRVIKVKDSKRGLGHRDAIRGDWRLFFECRCKPIIAALPAWLRSPALHRVALARGFFEVNCRAVCDIFGLWLVGVNGCKGALRVSHSVPALEHRDAVRDAATTCEDRAADLSGLVR
jgi:hypothetical protein